MDLAFVHPPSNNESFFREGYFDITTENHKVGFVRAVVTRLLAAMI